MQGPYPYFGPTGVLDYIDHYRIDEEFAVIGEDGDHFLKFRVRPMTLLFCGKANVNNHAHIVGDSDKCLARWFYYWFMHRDLTPSLSRQGVGRYKLTKTGLEKLEIWLPPIEEQLRITHILSRWENAAETTERLLAASRKQKQALMNHLLSGQKRLPQFQRNTGLRHTPHGSVPVDWSYPRIGEFAKDITIKRGASSAHPVLSCTKHDGLVDSLRYFNKQIYSADTSTYKMVPRNCFVYATNHIEEGSIGYQTLYDISLVSPMYTVFKTGQEISDDYLYKLLKTEKYRQIFAAATNASINRRGSLRWKEFKKLHVPLPSLEEQRTISKILNTADREIELLNRQLNLLRQEKVGLMQQLLVGKRRVRKTEATRKTTV